ncbi:hypothetical protein [Pseudonocardia nigra]|uniref:hypothetical protein n=1 Tax=Pseudonocardia nigra TaxID=1921578 RepID=UPI001C5DC8C0|nr:hypothetical protein [Pseudonocardia nigra]
MERGSAKHGARQDDALADELEGQLGPGGSNREEWADPEPPADDDTGTRADLPTGGAPAPGGVGGDIHGGDIHGGDTEGGDAEGGDRGGADTQDDAEMRKLQHDMAIANDWNPGDERS